MSASEYSGASVSPSSSRWARLVSSSALNRTRRDAGASESSSQAASVSAATPKTEFLMSARRLTRCLALMIASSWFYRIVAGDDRSQIVDEARHHDHRQMNDDEQNDQR